MVILSHNHPSGNTVFSNADKQLTEKLKEGGKILGIEVLDHIVLSGAENDVFNNEMPFGFRRFVKDSPKV